MLRKSGILLLLCAPLLAFVHKHSSLDTDTHNHAGHHERLDVKMRPIDIASFAAAHDQHHYETIKSILDNLDQLD